MTTTNLEGSRDHAKQVITRHNEAHRKARALLTKPKEEDG